MMLASEPGVHTECTQTVLNDDDNHGVQGISDEIRAIVLGRVSKLVATLRDQIHMQ
jgi:hypothetical protein